MAASYYREGQSELLFKKKLQEIYNIFYLKINPGNMTRFPGNKSTILLKTLQDQVLMTYAETCLESQIFGTRNMSNEVLMFTLILMYKY